MFGKVQPLISRMSAAVALMAVVLYLGALSFPVLWLAPVWKSVPIVAGQGWVGRPLRPALEEYLAVVLCVGIVAATATLLLAWNAGGRRRLWALLGPVMLAVVWACARLGLQPVADALSASQGLAAGEIRALAERWMWWSRVHTGATLVALTVAYRIWNVRSLPGPETRWAGVAPQVGDLDFSIDDEAVRPEHPLPDDD